MNRSACDFDKVQANFFLLACWAASMGIVVDLDRSNIEFKGPNALDQQTTIGQNVVDYQLYSFAIQFGIKFDPDPKIGFGGAPSDPDLYRIGIVQNVLHERLFFQYEKEDEKSKRTVKRIFEKEFDHPAVDIVENTFDRPFYSTPSFDSNKRKTRPVATIWYTGQGYGELLNPYSTSRVAIDNPPDTLDMWDQPGGGAFFTLPDGAMLMRMEKILGFQAWLVAKQASKIEVLAHTPAFSLMFWFETITKGFHPKSSFDTPPFKYGIYMEDGFVSSRKIDRKREGIGSVTKMRAVAGKGARNPVVTGPPASEGSLQWLAANKLHL